MGTTQNHSNKDFNCSYDQNFVDQRGRDRGHGKGLGRGGFCSTYFHCNEEGHHAFKFPQCHGRIDRRVDGQARVSHVDDYA